MKRVTDQYRFQTDKPCGDQNFAAALGSLVLLSIPAPAPSPRVSPSPRWVGYRRRSPTSIAFITVSFVVLNDTRVHAGCSFRLAWFHSRSA